MALWENGHKQSNLPHRASINNGQQLPANAFNNNLRLEAEAELGAIGGGRRAPLTFVCLPTCSTSHLHYNIYSSFSTSWTTTAPSRHPHTIR